MSALNSKFLEAWKKCANKALKDPKYKAELIMNTNAKLAEEGFSVPAGNKVIVHDKPNEVHLNLHSGVGGAGGCSCCEQSDCCSPK